MSESRVRRNSRTLCLGLALIFGLASFIGLLLVMDLGHPSVVALADGPTIRYVAPAPLGSDSSNDCTNSSTPCATIQHAVDEADPGSEVRVAAGLYTDVHARSSRDPTKVVTQVVHITKTLTVRGGYTTTNWSESYPITRPTTLDAQGRGRVLVVDGSISPTLEGLHLTGGHVAGSGGGINSWDANLVLSKVIISNNVSSGTSWAHGLGGGMHVAGGNVTLNESQVISNSASYKGGGVSVWGGSLTLDEVQIVQNVAKAGTFWDGGGGLYIKGRAIVRGGQIISNVASHGGGLYIYYSDVTLSEVQVLDNTATKSGGGVFTWWESTDLTIDGGAISGNSAGSGGGVACGGNFTQTGTTFVAHNSARGDGGGLALGGQAKLNGAHIVHNNAGGNGGGIHFGQNTAYATLLNSALAHNRADERGSVLYIGGGPYQLVHTTFASNSGGDGSGIHIAGEDSTVALTNTILVSHTVGITVAAGNTATLETTLWGTGPTANGLDWGGAGTIHTGTLNLWGDPAFAADGYHLTLASAALDRLDDTLVDQDIDGNPRPRDGDCSGGPKADLGAHEYYGCVYQPVVFRGFVQ